MEKRLQLECAESSRHGVATDPHRYRDSVRASSRTPGGGKEATSGSFCSLHSSSVQRTAARSSTEGTAPCARADSNSNSNPNSNPHGDGHPAAHTGAPTSTSSTASTRTGDTGRHHPRAVLSGLPRLRRRSLLGRTLAERRHPLRKWLAPRPAWWPLGPRSIRRGYVEYSRRGHGLLRLPQPLLPRGKRSRLDGLHPRPLGNHSGLAPLLVAIVPGSTPSEGIKETRQEPLPRAIAARRGNT